MGAYILSLMVTLDQELAIQTLFTQKNWQFIRIDQSASDGSSSVPGTFRLVRKNDNINNVAGSVKSKVLSDTSLKSKDLSESRPNVSNVTDGKEDELDVGMDTTSVDELPAIIVKEEIQSGGEQEAEGLVDYDYDTEDADETSITTQMMNKPTKRRRKSKTLSTPNKRQAYDSEIERTVKAEAAEESLHEDDDNLLAMLEELPDIKHISEIVTTKCSDSDLPSGTPPDIETDTNSYVASLAVYYCKWCQYTFPELKHFEGHKRKGLCFFVCQLCDAKFTFRNFSSYQDHLREHSTTTTEPGQYYCTQCGKSYKYKRNLITHERMHNGTLPFTCCGLSFPSRRRLERHRCTVHGAAKSHVCNNCRKEFSTHDDLLKHEQRESGLNALVCAICGNTFTTMKYLQQHMACHSDEKQFVCPQCGVRYKQASSLSRHRASKHPLHNE